MPALRVVPDANVLVSGLAYPDSIPGRIVAAWRRGALDVALPRLILDELERVLPRLNHRLNWRKADFADLIDALALSAGLVEPVPIAGGGVSDVAGIPVLGALLAASADYLITGDQDLLALAESYPIITPAGFWRRHGG